MTNELCSLHDKFVLVFSALIHFSQLFSDFQIFGLSTTEETWVVVMHIYSINIDIVLVLHFNSWVEAFAGWL
jgi:hypothetical protein